MAGVEIPVLSNFRPFGMAPNVAGGQRGDLSSVGFYDDTRTGVVAAASTSIYPGRVVMFDGTNLADAGEASREPRALVKAVTSAFAAGDFAGLALNRNLPIRGTIASATTVSDSQYVSFEAGDTLSRAVKNEWWFEYASSTVPARGAAVRVEVTTGNEGRVTAASGVGVALPTTVAVFQGRVELGVDGKYYALVNILNKLA